MSISDFRVGDYKVGYWMMEVFRYWSIGLLLWDLRLIVLRVEQWR